MRGQEQFQWNGKTYQFDACACYDGNSMIKLPDGKVLSVGGWLESLPPQPCGLKEENYLPGMEPEGCTPAQEV